MIMSDKLNFTKSSIRALSIPKDKKPVYYYDSKEAGLCLIITYGGAKTFYLSKKIDGKPTRIKLGRFPDITIENARKKAIEQKNLINKGINPALAKKNLLKSLTIQELFNKFVSEHKTIKPNTLRVYNAIFNNHFTNIQGKKIIGITKSDVERLHKNIKETVGLHTANRFLSLIKVLYSKATEWSIIQINPTLGVKAFHEQSRDRFLEPTELPLFFKALDEVDNITVKNYIYMSLFTGLRKTNVLSLKWDYINNASNIITITDTKNGETLKLPLNDNIKAILDEMKVYQINSGIKSKYIFYSDKSQSGHLEEPKKVWYKILEQANLKNLRLHDLRRTMGSYQAITGTSLHIIGKSLGHKTSKATEIYARMNLDPVKEAMEKATNEMMKYRKG